MRWSASIATCAPAPPPSARAAPTPPTSDSSPPGRTRAAPSTVGRKLAAIRGLFDSLVEAGKAGQNPADLVATPKKDSRLPRVLSKTEIEQLLDRIPARTALELRDRAMLELAYSSGLRAEEITTLDTGALDFEAERITVEGKG